MSTVSDFVSRFLPQAQQVSAQTGLPVDYVLGQAGLESGWGTSNAATSGNNFFGISPGGSLASYSSPDAGFQAYSDLINGPRYSGVSSVAGNGPTAIASYLNGQGYSTNPNYPSSVAGAVASVDAAMGPDSSGWGSFLSGGLGNQTPVAPGGTGLTAPLPGTGIFDNLGIAAGVPSLTWIEELAIRAMLVLVGIVLIAGGLYIAGARSGNLVQRVTR